MRTIKFRAWNLETKEMLDWKDMTGYTLYHLLHNRVDGLAIAMQFTGLLDKNGKEIYESDIIIAEGGIKRIVEFREGCFTEKNSFPTTTLPSHCEVIGNIYSNPELIN